MAKVCLTPFGVLGTRLLADKSIEQKGTAPDEQTAIVDVGGHHVTNPEGPSKALGAAKSIYQWVGIADAEAYDPEVVEAL